MGPRAEIYLNSVVWFHLHLVVGVFFLFSFIYSLVIVANFGPMLRDSLTHPMLITAYLHNFDLEFTGSIVTRLGS